MVYESILNPGSFVTKDWARTGLIGEEMIMFQKAVKPYLYTAFCNWRNVVFLKGNREVREALEQNVTAKTQDALMHGILALHYGTVNQKSKSVGLPNIYKAFPTEIYGYKIPESEEQIEPIAFAWATLMSRQFGWVDDIENAPYIIDLTICSPITVSFLPKIMVLGGSRMIRLMDSFYAPDLKGADWSEKLFDYLGPERYEQMIDLRLKETIDLLLLVHCKGNILDIGCGTGLAQMWLKKFYHGQTDIKLFGIDLSSKMLEKAEARGEVVMRGNAALLSPEQLREGFRTFGYDVEQFDDAILSYVDNWTTHGERISIFTTTQRLLKPGGILRLNVYDISSPNWIQYYREVLLGAGFQKVEFSENRLEARDGFRDVGFVFAQK